MTDTTTPEEIAKLRKALARAEVRERKAKEALDAQPLMPWTKKRERAQEQWEKAMCAATDLRHKLKKLTQPPPVQVLDNVYAVQKGTEIRDGCPALFMNGGHPANWARMVRRCDWRSLVLPINRGWDVLGSLEIDGAQYTVITLHGR